MDFGSFVDFSKIEVLQWPFTSLKELIGKVIGNSASNDRHFISVVGLFLPRSVIRSSQVGLFSSQCRSLPNWARAFRELDLFELEAVSLELSRLA